QIGPPPGEQCRNRTPKGLAGIIQRSTCSISDRHREAQHSPEVQHADASLSPAQGDYAPAPAEPTHHQNLGKQYTIDEIKDMMKKLSILKESFGAGPSIKTPSGKTPFTAEVRAEVLNPGSQLPTLESYDENTDPEDHVTQFQSTMVINNFLDVI